MVEIDVQQIIDGFLQGFQIAWQGIGQPLVNALIAFLLNDPVGEIVLAISIVTMIIGILRSAVVIRRRVLNS
jgi:Flp pilus assembly protein TadB